MVALQFVNYMNTVLKILRPPRIAIRHFMSHEKTFLHLSKNLFATLISQKKNESFRTTFVCKSTLLNKKLFQIFVAKFLRKEYYFQALISENAKYLGLLRRECPKFSGHSCSSSQSRNINLRF